MEDKFINVVGVKFRRAGKIYDFDAGDYRLSKNDKVVVETEKGLSLGIVMLEPRPIEKEKTQKELKKIIRLANYYDFRSLKKNARQEKIAFDFCHQKIVDRGLEMKLVEVEYLLNGKKAIFYFTAENRVDFRELVKDLVKKLRTRIEMRQIGVRDETKMIGGIGSCGKELCCAMWLRNFYSVTIKMAKDQNLALNPGKISGVCGRLLCCLAYEHECYKELTGLLPKLGKKIITPTGEAKVVKVETLKEKFTVVTEEGAFIEYRATQYNPQENKIIEGQTK